MRNRPIRNKNCLWRPSLLTNRYEMSNFIEDLPCMLSTKFQFIPESGFRGEDFLIRNKNGLWRPCLLMDRDKMSNLYRGPSKDATYQVSVHLAEGFQRRRLKCEKLTDDGHQVMAKAHIVFGKVS